MENIILYVNTEKAKKQFASLREAKQYLISVYDYILSKGFIPEKEDVEQAIKNRDFSCILERFKTLETDKIKKVIDTIGESALTDGWEQRIENKVSDFEKELKSKLPVNLSFEIGFIEYFDFESGVSVKNEYDSLDYFLDLNSVKIQGKEAHEFYKKHKTACKLLNELMKHPDNEFDALGKLFYFNTDTKEFEMSIETYSPEFSTI